MPSRSPRRRTALETVAQAFDWLTGFPALLALFLAVELVDVVVGTAGTTGLGVVTLLASTFAGGVAYVYAEAALEGRRPSLGTALSRVTRRFLSLVGVGIVYFVAVVVGTILLVLPGIYLAARLLVAFPAAVVDDVGAVEALSRGWDAGGGNVLKLLGIFLALLVPAFAAVGIAAAAFGLESVANRDTTALLLVAPVSAVLTATLELAAARVYVENRPTRARRDGPRNGRQDGAAQPSDPAESGDQRGDRRALGQNGRQPDDAGRGGGRSVGSDHSVFGDQDDGRR